MTRPGAPMQQLLAEVAALLAGPHPHAALAKAQQAAQLAPTHAEAQRLLMLAALLVGQPAVAGEVARLVAAHEGRTGAAHEGRTCEAPDAATHAAAARPTRVTTGTPQPAALDPQALHRLHLAAVVMTQLDERDAALALFARLTERAPSEASAWYDQGNALLMFGDRHAALASFERATRLNPAFADAWLNLAVTRRDLGEGVAAIADYRRAVALAPASFKAWLGLAEALSLVGSHAEAIACAQRALAHAPEDADAWIGLADALRRAGEYQQALPAYAQALAREPANERARVNRALALTGLDRHDEAYQEMHAAWHASGRAPRLGGLLLPKAQMQAEWRDIEPLWDASLELGVGDGVFNDVAFAQLCNPRATPQDQLASARAAVRTLGAPSAQGVSRAAEGASRAADAFNAADSADAAAHARTAGVKGHPHPAAGARPAPRRLRIGYLSADFCEHPLAYLMAGVFEQHARDRFEVFGLGLGPPASASPTRARVLAAFDHFVELGQLPAEAASARLRALGLDVLVDLMGHTKHARPVLLVQRSASVQVAYLGYPGTTGIQNVDYLIGDRWVTPPGHQPFYSEQLVRLPDSFQANDDRRVIASSTATRQTLGLPDGAFVFCCLNQTQKITPIVFDVWMRVLKAAPHSVLWLLGPRESVRENLRREAALRGVHPARLVFAARTPYAEYLARYRLADLFLDTWPFNAGTTASDALWAGLPVLTLPSSGFAGRMAESLLRASGLPEVVSADAAAYEQRAVALATDGAAELAALRQRLVSSRAANPLFDTARFTRHLESAFTSMVERHAQGLEPEGFDVRALPR